MFGTAMPEASIHKDRYAPTRKYDVGPHKPPADTDGEILAISEAQSVKSESKCHFRFRVRPPDRPHVS